MMLFLVLLLLAAPSWAAVAWQTTQTTAAESGTGSVASLTFAHTVGVGGNRLLLVGCTTGCLTSCPTTITGTYAGQAMSQLSFQVGGTVSRSVLLALVAPPVGEANVVITPENNQRIACGAITATGVHPSSPTGTVDDNTAFATSETCTATVPQGGGLLAAWGKFNSTEILDFTEVAGQTERWNIVTTNATPGGNVFSAGVTSTTAGIQTVTYTSTTDRQLTCQAVPINPNRGLPAGAVLLRRR